MSENLMETRREKLARRSAHAEAMGGSKKLEARRQAGWLNARERLAQLFDGGAFSEVGKLACSIHPEQRDRTPADGKICAFGKVEDRQVAAVSNDMTVLGASSSVTNAAKVAYMKRTASRNGMPLVLFGESSGSRIQDTMGARQMGKAGMDPEQYLRHRETPWVSAVLGSCFGSSSWYTCLADFVVMRKGACLAVSSDRVTSMAINQAVDAEELGGWKLHAQHTGMVDLVVERDEEAIDALRRFLSYLPSHAGETPPRREADTELDRFRDSVLELVPGDRKKVYDMRRVIENLVDHNSYFPLKDRFAKSVVTALTRIDGRSVGVLASNPKFKGGALDPDACDKAVSLLVLCDSFNIPLVILEDTPGFLVGVEGERKKAPGKIMNFMQAMHLFSMPKILVILRKSYGQAYLNFGGGRNSDESAAWVSAEVSFMDPHIGARVVLGGKDVAAREEAALAEALSKESSAFELAEVFGVQQVIAPEDTRKYLILALERHCSGKRSIGKHLMCNWPTTC